MVSEREKSDTWSSNSNDLKFSPYIFEAYFNKKLIWVVLLLALALEAAHWEKDQNTSVILEISLLPFIMIRKFPFKVSHHGLKPFFHSHISLVAVKIFTHEKCHDGLRRHPNSSTKYNLLKISNIWDTTKNTFCYIKTKVMPMY